MREWGIEVIARDNPRDNPHVTFVYFHPPNPPYLDSLIKFFGMLLVYRAGFEHKLVMVCQFRHAEPVEIWVLDSLPELL